MIIKEYRIPLPMTVEEYRIAQLYMIQVGGGAGAGPAVPTAALSTDVGEVALRPSQQYPSGGLLVRV